MFLFVLAVALAPNSVTKAYQTQIASEIDAPMIIPATGGEIAPVCYSAEPCLGITPPPTAVLPVLPDSCSLDYDFTFEQEVVRLVNEERARYDLPPLSWDFTLGDTARVHTVDMLCNRFAAHNNLSGEGPDARMLANGYDWFYFGENIAAGPSYATPEKVVKAWMGSSHHRANMLNPNFTEIGVGFAFSLKSSYDNYWTLDFGQQE
jgi:uncharacterized protein YkwD